MKIIIICIINIMIICESVRINANDRLESNFEELRFVPESFEQIDTLEKNELTTEFVIKHICQQQNNYRENGNKISFYSYGYFEFLDNLFFLYEKTDGYNIYIYICHYSDSSSYPKSLLIYQNNQTNFHIINGIIYITSINGNTEFPSLSEELYKLDSNFTFIKGI